MARFYFDFWNGECLRQDEDGMELDGVQAAGRQATLALGELMRDLIITGKTSDKDFSELSLIVRDAAGQEAVKATIILMINLLT